MPTSGSIEAERVRCSFTDVFFYSGKKRRFLPPKKIKLSQFLLSCSHLQWMSVKDESWSLHLNQIHNVLVNEKNNLELIVVCEMLEEKGGEKGEELRFEFLDSKECQQMFNTLSLAIDLVREKEVVHLVAERKFESLEIQAMTMVNGLVWSLSATGSVSEWQVTKNQTGVVLTQEIEHLRTIRLDWGIEAQPAAGHTTMAHVASSSSSSFSKVYCFCGTSVFVLENWFGKEIEIDEEKDLCKEWIEKKETKGGGAASVSAVLVDSSSQLWVADCSGSLSIFKKVKRTKKEIREMEEREREREIKVKKKDSLKLEREKEEKEREKKEGEENKLGDMLEALRQLEKEKEEKEREKKEENKLGNMMEALRKLEGEKEGEKEREKEEEKEREKERREKEESKEEEEEERMECVWKWVWKEDDEEVSSSFLPKAEGSKELNEIKELEQEKRKEERERKGIWVEDSVEGDCAFWSWGAGEFLFSDYITNLVLSSDTQVLFFFLFILFFEFFLLLFLDYLWN